MSTFCVLSLFSGASKPGADAVRAAAERAAVPAEAAPGEEIRREQAVLLGDPVHAGQRRHRRPEEAGHAARQAEERANEIERPTEIRAYNTAVHASIT